ncbi:MAG: YidE/YbjL duplication [Spirochaetes bacterium]|uniref:YidE/YbjL duplication n=1 Tax=Candidatus Gallitreponema excrementavium TaxID=2840840 RepID=A0A9D9N269_9SPIR|nr:YidE/YbjL duplication [Candidatus Gallitreponema excrementavium]
MVEYTGEFLNAVLSVVFVSFTIATLGYLVGGVKIKGISLGTAGVLLVALVYGVVLSYFPSFKIGEKVINLYNATIKSNYSFISNIGTALFVTAVGLIAGPKFFRTLNKNSLAYILNGLLIIVIGGITAWLFLLFDKNLSKEMVVGLLTGGLTSTPGLSSAKEVAQNQDAVVAGYGIAYLFGVLGVVLFVQIVPRILKVDMEKERETYVAVNAVQIPEAKPGLVKLDPYGFFPFFIAIALGSIIGSFHIPGINFSLGTSGGTLVAGLLIGHFGRIGKIDCRVTKDALNFFRELGLVLFLIGAGVPGGINFIEHVKLTYFIYGAVMTVVPMVAGFLVAKYVFKLSIFNNLGSITGGMTSTPALGTLISTTGTDEVASAYAATYPIALVSVVLLSKLIILL